MTVALVRHGRTAWNHERRLQGRTDIPLDDHGREQADVAGRLLARGRWDRIVSSPLRRAAETAWIIQARIGAPGLEIDDAFVERDFGDAEGLQVGDASERWVSGDYPGAESWEDLQRRAHVALDSVFAREGLTVVVAHGTFIRAGVQAATGSSCPRILNGQVVMLTTGADGRRSAHIMEN